MAASVGDWIGDGSASSASRERDLVGADVVEVLPDRIGSRDITALVADRIVRELLTGVAVARTRTAARAAVAV
jgi:hypothetical protein